MPGSGARLTALVVVVLSVAGLRVREASPRTYESLFERPSPQSLRNAAIDLDDPWSAARLLAEFGEGRDALDRLRGAASAVTASADVHLFQARLLAEAGSYASADSALSLIADAWSPRTRYLQCLQHARLDVMRGECERAIACDERIGRMELAEFEPYRDLIAVEALSGAGKSAEAYERAKRRWDRGLPSTLSPAFELRYLEACLEAGRDSVALSLIDELKRRKSQKALFAPVVAREPGIRLLMGDSTGAVRASLDFVHAYGPVEGSQVVADVLGRIRPESLENAVLLDFAEACVSGSRRPEAARLLDALSRRALVGSDEERVRLSRSELRYAERHYDQAKREVATSFVDPSLERRAALLRARIYRAAGDSKRSAGAYESFARSFPLDPKSPQALYAAAELYEEIGSDSKATDLFSRIVDANVDQKYSRLAAIRLGLGHADRREYAAAARTFERALARERWDDETLLYHLANARGRLGDSAARDSLKSKIESLDPYSFYLDPRAALVGGSTSGAAEGARENNENEKLLRFMRSVHDEREATRNRISVQLNGRGAANAPDSIGSLLDRGRAFLEMGFTDWAEAELTAFESAGGVPPWAWMELGALFDDFAVTWRSVLAYQRVYYSLDRAVRVALDRDFRLLMYPVPFPSTVSENCVRRGFPTHLAYAMIREESRFRREAVSGAGAQGLMQIMPETGEQIVEELGASEAAEKNLLLPEVNLAVGISYAAKLLDRSKHDPLMMLAAYNAGFSNARKWFTGKKARKDPAETVDRIDYGETRDYVKRVVESARIYYSVYFSPDSPVPLRP
jgi:tetratricopeptide (TPR) repeat protein